MLRMNNQQNPCIALTWAPEGKRTRGRPKVTWRRTVEGERQKMGFTTWSEAATAARDRAGWRRQVNGPILPEEIKETKKRLTDMANALTGKHRVLTDGQTLLTDMTNALTGKGCLLTD